MSKMSGQENADYLAHLQRIAAELAILLDTYHLGEDRAALQAAYDAIREIRERLYKAAREEADQGAHHA